MVYESRVGDVFTLGTSTWRIEDITHDRVLVTPAPGLPGRLPFWKGDTLGRPAELGRAVGAFVREVGRPDPGQGAGPGSGRRARRVGGRQPARPTSTSSARRPATCPTTAPSSSSGSATSSATGGWRCTRRSAARCTPRGRCASRRGCASGTASTCRPCTATTGSCFRLPDLEFEDDGPAGSGAELLELVRLDAGRGARPGHAEIGGSALFAARFRECAARALLLPRRRPDRRQPLWQQRQRAAQLLEVASQYASFPIVLETVRECVQDVFDVPGLDGADARRSSRARSRWSRSRPRSPRRSPGRCMFGYVAQFLYEGDSPLAERRAAALVARPDPAGRAARPGRGPVAARPARPRRGDPHRARAAAARRPSAPAATPRTSPTCCACSARCPSTTCGAVARRR